MAATIVNTPINSYSITDSGTTPDGLIIRDVPDWTKMLRRQDIPFTKMIGRSSAPGTPMLKREWGWGSPDPVKDQLAEALDSSETGIDVDHGEYFQVGHLIRVDDEIMLVTAIVADTLTVTRGYSGSTAATHADDAPVYVLGPAMSEFQDDQLSPITQGELDFNYPQYLQFGWKLSQRARVTPTYESKNFPGTRDQQELRKKMEYTAPLQLERVMLEGLRSAGSPTTASTMGGIRQPSFFTTHVAMGGAPLTEYDLMEMLQDVYQLVGQDQMSKTVMCSMFIKRVISSWYNDNRRYTGSDKTANVVFDEIDTEFGRIRFVVNYQLDELGRSGDLFLFNPKDFKLQPYASSTGWQTGMLSTNGWYTQGFLRGDYTLLCENPDNRAKMTSISTTASDYPSIA